MDATKIISKHLNKSLIKNVETVKTICAFTGDEISEGVHKKHAIRDTFTDHPYLKYQSDYVGLDVYSTMDNIIQGKKGMICLRNFSFISNNENLIFLKNSEIMEYLLKPIDPPFVFCISFSNKKHLAFKAKVNVSRKDFIVTTDVGDCLIDQKRVNYILPIIQNWYSIIPGKEETTLKETWFTKQEILSGSANFKKIEQYGSKFFDENQIIAPFRNTLFLKILVHCLNKK